MLMRARSDFMREYTGSRFRFGKSNRCSSTSTTSMP